MAALITARYSSGLGPKAQSGICRAVATEAQLLLQKGAAGSSGEGLQHLGALAPRDRRHGEGKGVPEPPSVSGARSHPSSPRRYRRQRWSGAERRGKTRRRPAAGTQGQAPSPSGPGAAGRARRAYRRRGGWERGGRPRGPGPGPGAGLTSRTAGMSSSSPKT